MTDHVEQVMPAVSRISRYLALRAPMRGIDPEQIHVLGVHPSEGYTVALTVPDLAAVLLELKNAQERVREMAHAEHLLASREQYINQLEDRLARMRALIEEMSDV